MSGKIDKAQSVGFKTNEKYTGFQQVPISYFESIHPYGTKPSKPETWLERLPQYIERVDETDVEPVITQI